MSVLIKDNQLLQKYHVISVKAKNIINKKIDSKPVPKEKDLNTKIRFMRLKLKFILLKPMQVLMCVSIIITDSVFKIS